MSTVPVPTGHELLVPDSATLQKLLPIEAGRVRSRRLHHGGDGTVLGVAMDAGAVMREHIAPVPILIHVVEGQTGIVVDGEQIELSVGSLLHVEARVPHELEARVPTRFLLTLLGSPAALPTPVAQSLAE